MRKRREGQIQNPGEMNAVGIDVSKGKSMVAALRPMGEVALTPREFPHTELGLEQMADAIIGLGEETRVVMEATGRYHEPVAAALHEYGIFVSVLNPLYIKQSGGGSIRKVKTDKADAMKIAKYALDNWVKLQEYTPMDAIRQQLKLYSRQYDLYMKTNVALQNNLISLTDKVYPGVNELFSSPERPDGHQKWVDFVMTFWHRDCLCRISQEAFTERYRKWCKRNGSGASEKVTTSAPIKPLTCMPAAASTTRHCPGITIPRCWLQQLPGSSPMRVPQRQPCGRK